MGHSPEKENDHEGPAKPGLLPAFPGPAAREGPGRPLSLREPGLPGTPLLDRGWAKDLLCEPEARGLPPTIRKP